MFSSTWSFEPTWDPLVGDGNDLHWLSSGLPDALAVESLDPLAWEDLARQQLPPQLLSQSQHPCPALSASTRSSSSSASSSSMMMELSLEPEFANVAGEHNYYTSTAPPSDNESQSCHIRLVSAPAKTLVRPRLGFRRASAVAAKTSSPARMASRASRASAASSLVASSSRVATGRSHSWSAAVTAAPVYKYVAHAQLAMQCGQPKNSVENQNAWLQIARISHERRDLIANGFVQKYKSTGTGSAEAVVDHVLALFSQHYVREKIAILAREHVRARVPGLYDNDDSLFHALQARDLDVVNASLWLDQKKPRNTACQVKQIPRLTVFDELRAQNSPSALAPGLLAVEVRTSSGYNNFTASSTENSTLSEWDCDLLQLRHMSLLRESDDRRRKNKYYEFIEGKMKRPLNSFMLYRSALMKAVAILKVCSVVTDTCQVLSRHYPQLAESQLLSVVGSVVQDIELPFNLPVEIDCDVVRAAIQSTMYEPINENNPDAGLKPVDPKFANQTDVAQVITLMWNTEPHEFKQRFVEFSQIEKQHHHQVFPKYKYCPVKKDRTSA
ncbi:LAME_0H00562g1_1 [Lachancea meyersii CBS 8951]|uniref:LAME_0H00562g1_1 n=1 Tax=Lachancea meyersii CBS 8951 TaxID=1266667 RepID=A0A1G4KD34_9SACH|nr:LAME_0H00562g1_1 [Lachancea meyersii CBS 8951]